LVPSFIAAILFAACYSPAVLAFGSGPLVSVIGWNGDKDAVIAYVDGSYQIRAGKNTTIGFNAYNSPSSLQWYNEEGYLPCLTTSFERDFCTVKIMNFCDSVTIGGNGFVVAYSRVSVYNHGTAAVTIDPAPGGSVLALTANPTTVAAGATVNHDFAIAADKFGASYAWPPDNDLKAAGGWDAHYAHMKSYWNNRLSGIVAITSLPDTTLINAYKAGFIYTHIVKDGRDDLNVGENGYDQVFDHDYLGILVTLLVVGDYDNARNFLNRMSASIQYDDARFKYAWPFALYLLKTGDSQFITDNWSNIQSHAHETVDARTGPGGIIKQTWDIDNTGYWTVDNFSALTGLAAYTWLCGKMNNTSEQQWAAAQYSSLLKGADSVVASTIRTNNLNYIPCSMVEPNTQNVCNNPRNTNWASFLKFGRWAWDGYLLNAQQYGVMITMIDSTYDYGFTRGQAAGLPAHCFGGGSGNNYCGGYNAGFGIGGLRSNRHRSESIYAYQMMINKAQCGPFSWWESEGDPAATSWQGIHPGSGDGSCPHLWGQSFASKGLVESLIAERFDGSVIIGRGIPPEWLTATTPIALDNYPISTNKRMGYSITMSSSDRITLTLTGDAPQGAIAFNLPIFLGQAISASAGVVDNTQGLVTLQPSTRSVTVSLSADTTKPRLLAAVTPDKNTVTVTFSKALKRTAAETMANYAITGGVTITSATLGSDLKTVYLAVSSMTAGNQYSLTVNNLYDLASTPNRIPANSTVSFGYLLIRPGLHYDYYEGTFTSTTAISSQPPVASGIVDNFTISVAQRSENFGVQFVGQLFVSRQGAYAFFTNSDDGSVLYIDGNLVVNNDGNHAAQERSGTAQLTAGYHAIRVAYFQSGGGKSLTVSWQGQDFDKGTIPDSLLSHTPDLATANGPSLSHVPDRMSMQVRVIPGKGAIAISVNQQAPATVEILSLSGSLMGRFATRANTVVVLTSRHIRRGMYVVRVSSENESISRRVMVAR
jgi:hypothetical protein